MKLQSYQFDEPNGPSGMKKNVKTRLSPLMLTMSTKLTYTSQKHIWPQQKYVMLNTVEG
jgi:hypothetical protein